MATAARLLFIAACLAVWTAAGAQKTPIRDVLQQRGYTSFLDLAEVAGISEPNSRAVLTIFAPTNKAIEDFLNSMKLSLQDVKGRPGLAAAVIGYHVLPRVKGRTSDVKGFSRAAPLEAISADDTHYLRFFMGPDNRVVVEDVQNNTANFVSDGQEVGNVIIYGIDRVLLSGDVFTTLDGLLEANPQFRPLRALYAKAGLEGEVLAMTGKHNTLTVFVPTADAVKSAEAALSALPLAQLQDVLRYHIVPDALAIPAGLTADKPYPTAFKGHDLKFKYNKVLPSAAAKGSSNSRLPQRQQQEARVTVEIVPEAGTFGSKAVAGLAEPKVTIANLYANRMIIHGINQVLKPNLPKAAPAPVKPAAASKAAEQPASKPAGGSPAAAATGRKLLQFRTGAGPSVLSTSMTSTQSSIRSAVDGTADIFDATGAGRTNARSAATRCWNCVVDDWGRH